MYNILFLFLAYYFLIFYTLGVFCARKTLVMKRIAVLASGSGSNAENLVEYFRKGDLARVTVILSNRKDAFVLERAQRLGVPYLHFSRDDFYSSDKVLRLLLELQVDLVVLAGFLWLVPPSIVASFEHRIVNIHPALLPKFGGKGMFGMHVHEAVVQSRENETGITIHWVNSQYDEGDVIFQAKASVLSSDSADDVANKVHQLEYEHFPVVLERILLGI